MWKKFFTFKKKLGPLAYGSLISIFYTKITLLAVGGAITWIPNPPKTMCSRFLCFMFEGCVLFSRWLTQSLIVILLRSGPLQHSWRASFSSYSYAPWQLLVWKWENAWIPALLAQDSLWISTEARGNPEMPNNCESRVCSIQIRWRRRENGHTGRKEGKTWLLTHKYTGAHKATDPAASWH